MKRFVQLTVCTLLVFNFSSLNAAPFTPTRNYEQPFFSFLLGLGAMRGGERVGGVTVTSTGNANLTYVDDVTLGGEQYYYGGVILSLGRNAEVWLSYGQMKADSSSYSLEEQLLPHPGYEYDHELTHDRVEMMFFAKSEYYRFGAGVVKDSDIKLRYRDIVNYVPDNQDYTFDDSNGWSVGVGLDMKNKTKSAALHLDYRYIRMKYKFFGQELNANSMGFYLSGSF